MTKVKFFCVLLCFTGMAQAHNFAPSLLELWEQPGNVIDLVWRTPLQAVKQPAPVLPQGCRRLGEPQQSVNGSAVEFRYSIVCPAPVANLRFSVAGLSESKTAALLRWYSAAGGRQQVLLRADSDHFTPQAAGGVVKAFSQFSALGVSHILLGTDHLLFVLGLLMLAAGFRQLVVLVTSFTLGHSISLALVSLGFIPQFSTLAEWLIALSVLMMACYLGARDQYEKPHTGMTLLVGGFGLLHGLGFAGVLNEILDGGGGILPALVGFNVGIELGQLVFIAVVLASAWLLQKFPGPRLLSGARWAAIYLMGSVSMYWLFDRGLILLEAGSNLAVY